MDRRSLAEDNWFRSFIQRPNGRRDRSAEAEVIALQAIRIWEDGGSLDYLCGEGTDQPTTDYVGRTACDLEVRVTSRRDLYDANKDALVVKAEDDTIITLTKAQLYERKPNLPSS